MNEWMKWRKWRERDRGKNQQTENQKKKNIGNPHTHYGVISNTQVKRTNFARNDQKSQWPTRELYAA